MDLEDLILIMSATIYASPMYTGVPKEERMSSALEDAHKLRHRWLVSEGHIKEWPNF